MGNSYEEAGEIKFSHNLNFDAGVFSSFYDEDAPFKYGPDPSRTLETWEFERTFNKTYDESDPHYDGGARIINGNGKVG